METVTIPIPTKKNRKVGIYACKKGYDLRLRASREDKELLQKAAMSLDLSLSTFVKECSLSVANIICNEESNNE